MKAFPNTKLMQQAVSFDNDEGMDLRDYFAAKAMQSMLSMHNWEESWDTKTICELAYMVADTMMEERAGQ